MKIIKINKVVKNFVLLFFMLFFSHCSLKAENENYYYDWGLDMQTFS